MLYLSLFIWACIACTIKAQTETKNNIKTETAETEQPLFVSHEVDVKNGKLGMYWLGNDGPLKTFANLKDYSLRQVKKLKFAINGGMYLKDYSPQGLYIENGKTFRSLNTKKSDYGNFYLAPNGIFYITKDLAANVCPTEDFTPNENINYATQSGPMLVIDSTIHPKFMLGSKNVHIRNGVGILPNGNSLFAISTKPVNLYDFADFFRKQGCKNALYLDGFVSRLYLPEKGVEQMDGNFGVMIGEVY